ncbi:hypothetical protein [Thiobacillus sp. 65-1402]|uniref:hypothetical protein n=1 Tax=Thiobacillus sp. 65-1402 TaxID=1895861 RepID=UPI00096967EA|nr:hypothetical protein [Thiobacillus sp. 65-1402]OJW78004.1 MAG: hypothetical protein BGO62_10555 [Thiobacillus sp. 65-1402]
MLSDLQKSQALHDGGAVIAARKAHMARTATALRKIDPNDYGLTAGESTAIRAALTAMDKVIASLAKDAREADAIRKDYEKRLTAARKEFATLLYADVADCIALIATAERVPFYGFELRSFRDRSSPVGNSLHTKARDAIHSIAHTCARDKLDPATRRQEVLAGLPALKERHADLIRELTTLAVAERLEQTA